MPKAIKNSALKNQKKYQSKNTRKCRYCGVSRQLQFIKWIPKDSEQLSKWIEILGPEFAENIKQFKTNSVCEIHIDSATDLPVKSNDSHASEEVEEIYNEVTVKNEVVSGASTSQSTTLNNTRWIKQEGELEMKENIVIVKQEPANVTSPTSEIVFFNNSPTSSSIKMVIIKEEHGTSTSQTAEIVYVDNSEIKTETGVLPSSSNNRTIVQCRACGKNGEDRTMTCIPTNHVEVKQWIELLDSDFLQNLVAKTPPHFVCWTHVKDMLAKMCQQK